MPAFRARLFAASLAMLICGCGTVHVSLPNSSTSVSRTGDELTVKIGGGPITAGSGKTADEKRKVAAFHKLSAAHGIQVQIEDAGADELVVEADDNLLPLIETSIESDTLHVRVAGSLKTRNAIRVKASAEQLSSLSASSSARITAARLNGAELQIQAKSSGEILTDHAQGEQIAIAASSSGQVTAKKIECKNLRVTASSSGRVVAAGLTDQQQVEVSSSGHYDAGQLDCRQTHVECSSSGSAIVLATQEIVGSASSSGSIRYAGDPAKVSVQTNSSGSVAKAER